MTLPPAVMVHSLAQAQAAMAPGLPVTLLSAPNAGIYAGAGWWLALMQAAAGDGQVAPHILDCGSAAGRALEAIRAGQIIVILRAADTVFAEVAMLAAAQGATVLAAAPPSLDLRDQRAARRLHTHLGQTQP